MLTCFSVGSADEFLPLFRWFENSPFLSGNCVKPTHTTGVSSLHVLRCNRRGGGKTESGLRRDKRRESESEGEGEMAVKKCFVC